MFIKANKLNVYFSAKNSPVIPALTKEAVEKLKELYQTQLDCLGTIQLAVENVTQVTGQKIRLIGWIFNDAEWLIERQRDELSDHPNENTDLKS